MKNNRQHSAHILQEIRARESIWEQEFKQRALRDIQQSAKVVREKNVDRINSMYGKDSSEAEKAINSSMMSAAMTLIDRWGIRFEPQVCDALHLDPNELNHYLCEAEIAELVDDPEETKTGSADPESIPEIMKQINRIEESLHNIGQQVEAIWLKTGAVELDAESIAEDLEETDTEQ